MNEIHDLSPVIESGYCIGCGACAAVDSTVELGLNDDRQIIEPLSRGSKKAAEVCPSVHVNYFELEKNRFGRAAEGPIGVVDTVYLAQSTNVERNDNASSGGLIKETIAHLLNTGVVDGVITIKHVNGLEYSAQLLDDAGKIDQLPGSIYHNISYQDLYKILENTDKKLAIVALPCQLEGLYKYILKYRKDLQSRVVFTIGLLCAWQYTRHSIRAIAQYEGFDWREVSDVAYRGGGPIGKLRIDLKNEKTISIDRRANINYQVAFDRYFNTPRCVVCVNHTNFLADLVVGDSWMQSTRFTRTGISLAIARTTQATNILKDMATSKKLFIHPVSEAEVVESEGESLVYGSFAYSYHSWLKRNNAYSPDLDAANRRYAKKFSDLELEKFHRSMLKKRKLLARGLYREIWWRKIVFEGHRMVYRYLKWFMNRVLKLKKITGRDKHVKRQDMREFR